MDADAVVVGAGVVGLACARELAARGRSVVLLERHERFGVETSSRNSEVVHAGIHYPAGSLKATLCARGNASLYAWCASHGVPHRRVGKLIVATGPAEAAQLEEIQRQAEANGVRSLEPLSPTEARLLEPHVRCSSALWSPETGIVDSHVLMASLLADAEAHGLTAAWRQEVCGVEPIAGGYRVAARDAGGDAAAIAAPWVVNAAGLDADTVAALAGFDVDACGYRQQYVRGHYFRVHPRKSHLVQHLVYPTPLQAGLGIHVTLDLAGGLRLGPDVQYLPDRRQDYAVADGLRPAFHAAVSRYLDGLALDDLSPDLAGIRPKLQGPGEPFRDFVIREESDRGRPGWLDLVGIESPGLTSCLEIGVLAATLLEESPVISRDRVTSILDGMQRRRIVVVGDAMLDVYLIGDVDRISPEAPVPVVTVHERRHAVGGAANVAANVAAIGAHVSLVASLGDDRRGEQLRAEMAAAGISDHSTVTLAGRPTTSKTRVVARGQQLVRIDEEEDAGLEGGAQDAIIAAAKRALADADAVLIEDYNKGVLTPAVIEVVLDAARARGIPSVVDPKFRNFFAYRGATIFKPNRRELEGALGAAMDLEHADALPQAMERLDVQNLLLTLGAHGMVLVSRDGALSRIPTVAREVYDVSGAGDTVTAWAGSALASGASVQEAAELANYAAGIEVGKSGVAVVTRDEVLDLYERRFDQVGMFRRGGVL